MRRRHRAARRRAPASRPLDDGAADWPAIAEHKVSVSRRARPGRVPGVVGGRARGRATVRASPAAGRRRRRAGAPADPDHGDGSRRSRSLPAAVASRPSSPAADPLGECLTSDRPAPARRRPSSRSGATRSWTARDRGRDDDQDRWRRETKGSSATSLSAITMISARRDQSVRIAPSTTVILVEDFRLAERLVLVLVGGRPGAGLHHLGPSCRGRGGRPSGAGVSSRGRNRLAVARPWRMQEQLLLGEPVAMPLDGSAAALGGRRHGRTAA